MPTDPVFSFANAVTDHLANRQQRLYALAYIRTLQTDPGKPLSQALPPALYRPVRRFIADAEWDGRKVIRRAVAEVLPYLEVEWLSCQVSSVQHGHAWAWLGASTARATVPLDVVLIGPDGFTRSAADYVPSQLDVLQAADDQMLRRAPLGLAGMLAERGDVRAWLNSRGVTYSAKVRPFSAGLGSLATPRGRTTLPRLLEHLADERSTLSATEPSWLHLPVRTGQTDGLADETLVVQWDGPELTSVLLTNERDPAALGKRYNPGLSEPVARARTLPRWRPPRLRGARAWEHHLALNSVVELYGQERVRLETSSDD